MKTKRKLNKPLLTKNRRARYFDGENGSTLNTGNASTGGTANASTEGTSSGKSAGDYVAGGLQALSGGMEIIGNQLNRNREMVQNIRDTRDQIISNTEATTKNDLNMMAASSSSLADFANSAKTFSLADNVHLNYRDFLGSKGNAAMNIMGATMSGAGAGSSAGGGWGALGGGVFGLLAGGIGWAKRKRKAKKETAEANRRINAVIDATNRQKLGAFSNAASNAEMNQESNEMLNFLSNNFSTGGGIHIKKANRGKFTESANRAGMGVQEYARHILANKDDYSSTLIKRANFARNSAKWHAEGGNLFESGGSLNSNGANFSNGLTYIDNGGTHEENPLEGVQMGMDNQGIPNLVEEGEVIYNDYVFTNRWKTPKSTKEALGVKKKSSVTYADVAKELSAESKERVNDPITKDTLERNLEILAQSQEADRAKREARKARREFNNLSPEEQLGIMQNAQQYQQEQDMANIPMNNQFAEGGDIPPYSDEYSSDQTYQDYLLQRALMDSYYDRTAGSALSENIADKASQAEVNRARKIKEANARRVGRNKAARLKSERESEEAEIRTGLRRADVVKSQRGRKEAAENAEYRRISDEMTPILTGSIASAKERNLAERQAKFDKAVKEREAKAVKRKAKYERERQGREEALETEAFNREDDRMNEAIEGTRARREAEETRRANMAKNKEEALALEAQNRGIEAGYRGQLDRELSQSSQDYYDRNIDPVMYRDVRERASEREINDSLNLNRGFEVSPSSYSYDLRKHAPLIAEGDNVLFDNVYNPGGSEPSAWNPRGRLTAITSEAARNNALNNSSGNRQTIVDSALDRNITNRVREKSDTISTSTPDSMPFHSLYGDKIHRDYDTQMAYDVARNAKLLIDNPNITGVNPATLGNVQSPTYFGINDRFSPTPLYGWERGLTTNRYIRPNNALVQIANDKGIGLDMLLPEASPLAPMQPGVTTPKKDVVTPTSSMKQDKTTPITPQSPTMPTKQGVIPTTNNNPVNKINDSYRTVYNRAMRAKFQGLDGDNLIPTPSFKDYKKPVFDITLDNVKEKAAALKGNNKKGKGKFGEKFKNLNLGRYAPVLGNLAATLTNLMTKPDYSRANALKEEAKRVGNWNPVTPNLLSERAYYRPINPLEAMNTYMAQANASRKDLLNTAGGNKALAMSSLSSARNRDIGALSKAQLDIENANLNRYNEVQRFNAGISQYNSEASLRAALANEQARLNASNARAGLMDKAFAMQDAIDAQRNAALSSSFTNLFDNIGEIGRERDARNMVKFGLETGSFGNVSSDLYNKYFR